MVPQTGLVLVAVGAGPASPAAVLGRHVAVVLPGVTEVLQSEVPSQVSNVPLRLCAANQNFSDSLVVASRLTEIEVA